MIKRIAALIAAEMPQGSTATYIPLARALVNELREPTPEMLEMAMPGALDHSDIVEDWQAMLDAALVVNEPAE